MTRNSKTPGARPGSDAAPTIASDSPAVPRRGRPRSEAAEHAIIAATMEAVLAEGFRAVSLDIIARIAGVGRMTIYRRWPNKAALVMDAFLATVGPTTGFPAAPTALESIQRQMRAQVKAFRGPYGALIKSLLGEAQFDEELAVAFRDRWIMPRRVMAIEALSKAIAEGDLREDIDVEAAVDQLYAPIYYRLVIGTGPLTDRYADTIFSQVTRGLIAKS